MLTVRTKGTRKGRKGRCGTTYLDHENMPKVGTGGRASYKPEAVAEPQLMRGHGAGRRRSQSGCRS
eukprot:3867437-Pleurochrysis_carterae.AAC.1